jgi:hypothetical protein
MTVSLKHTFQSAKTDSGDVTIVQPSNWNEEHELTLATNKVLGRATAGTGAAEELSIGTALSISGGTLAVTTVPAANGGTGLTSPGTSGNVLTSNGTSWTSATPASTPVNFPQNILSANYTLVLSDAGKQIFHPASDANVRTFTIPANSSVAFPIGTVVLFTVENNGTTVNVTINSDTLINGDGVSGTQPVPPNNTLMCIKVTATKWMANYLYQQDARSRFQIATANSGSPYVNAYAWSSGTGFGAKYANPATVPTGYSNSVAFAPAGNALAVAHEVTPFVTAYPWTSAGFGTKYTNPATLATNSYGVAFSPTSDAIALAHAGSPNITAYPWSSGAGFGTKYANPATLPTGVGYGVAFSPTNNAIAVAHFTSPFITAYPWSSSTGFGTKYTNPATLPASTGRGVTFSPAGDAIAVAHATTPFVTVYPWSASGFGTKYTNPATLPTGQGLSVAFSPSGNALAVAHENSPFVTAYPWSTSGFGTKYNDPVTAIPATTAANSVAFSPDGSSIGIAFDTFPFVNTYPWSDAGFTSGDASYRAPQLGLSFNALGVAFNASF